MATRNFVTNTDWRTEKSDVSGRSGFTIYQDTRLFRSLVLIHVINELTDTNENLIKVQELVNFIRSDDLLFILIRDWNMSSERWSNSTWWTPLTWRWNRRQTWNLHAPLMTDYWTTYRSSQDLRGRSSWSRSDQFHKIRTLTRKNNILRQHVHRLWKLKASRGISRKKRQRKGRIIVPIARHNMRKRDRTCRASYERWKSLSRCPSRRCVNDVCVTGWMHGIFMTV